jgi:hypothetical protein
MTAFSVLCENYVGTPEQSVLVTLTSMLPGFDH